MEWIAGTTVFIFLFSLAAVYIRHKTLLLAGNILWLLLVLALLGLYLWWQRHLAKQLENLIKEKPLPFEPFFIQSKEIKQLEALIRSVAEKMNEYQTRLIRQTARQAGESLKWIVNNSLDGLTGVANRKCLDKRVVELMSKQIPFSLIMLDLDHFKKVNDTFGHQAGDEVLQQFAGILTRTVRPGDLVARYGGEEFTVICLSDMDNAIKVAERIRSQVEMAPVTTCEGEIPITCSLGVAERNHRDTAESLFKRADQNLYLAKQQGRNRVKGEEKRAAYQIKRPNFNPEGDSGRPLF